MIYLHKLVTQLRFRHNFIGENKIKNIFLHDLKYKKAKVNSNETWKSFIYVEKIHWDWNNQLYDISSPSKKSNDKFEFSIKFWGNQKRNTWINRKENITKTDSVQWCYSLVVVASKQSRAEKSKTTRSCFVQMTGKTSNKDFIRYR